MLRIIDFPLQFIFLNFVWIVDKNISKENILCVNLQNEVKRIKTPNTEENIGNE